MTPRNHPGWRPELLRRHRDGFGLTLEAVSEAIRGLAPPDGFNLPDASFQMVGRHERGEVYPGRDYRMAYCMIYQSTEYDLGFRSRLPHERSHGPDADRAHEPMAATGVSGGTHGPTRIASGQHSADTVPSGHQEALAVTDAESALRFLVRAENANSPEILALLWNETRRLTRTYGDSLTWLVDDLVIARKAVFRLLDSPAGPRQTRDLYFLGGILCSMLAHTSRDLGRLDSTRSYQETALLCAERAGHAGLYIVVRTEQAASAYWQGLYPESVRYARLGNEAARVRGSIAVLPAVQEARAWAAMGNAEMTRAALDQGRRIRDCVTNDDLDEMGGMMRFSLPEQLGIVAGTAAWLPDPIEAEQAAAEAVNAYRSAAPADHSFNSDAIAHADLALSRVRQRALDGASDAVGSVLRVPPERLVLPIRSSLERLHHSLVDPVFRGSRDAHDMASEIESFLSRTDSAGLSAKHGAGDS